ncbi:MAG TPA: phosphate ABC transporter substrate-binding protein [Thermoanaerobaculia bacterium]|nr:phosphate ABC transporter substrate-binding protein [Thermoanaerobaculia bacterium]
MKDFRTAAVVFPLVASLLVACGGGERTTSTDTAGNQGRTRPITVKGSDTMVILGQRFAEEYMKQNPGTVIQVNGGGSGTGIAALINGTVDLAQSSRAMSDAEKASVEKQRSAQVVETPVALDTLAVFVNASSPVRQMTIEQVRNIYMGKVTNWNQVGGPNSTIVIYGRESSSGTYDYFREHVLDEGDFSPRVQTLAGTAAIINAVSKDPNGIGYGGIAYSKDATALALSEGAGPAVAPSETSVADGTYPLSRNLYFYTLSTASDSILRFVEWTISPAGQAVVENVGYFPLNQPATAGSDTTATETAAAGADAAAQ